MKNARFQRKAIFISCILYLCFLLISFRTHANGVKTLNILNWDDYVSTDVIKAWEDQTGANVRIIIYDDEVVRDALLTDPRQNQIDLAIVDAQSAQKLAELNYLINLEDTSMQESIDPRWLNQCGKFATPYLWGTFGIAYRTDKVTSDVRSWGDLFSSREDLTGHIGMLSDYYSLIAPALLVLNLPANTDEEQDLKQAYELLKQQAGDVLTYEYAPSYLLNSNKRDRLYAAAVYSGDQYSMNDLVGSEVWDYVLPDEGSFVWLDCWVVPIKSKKKNLAMSFLKFIGQPSIAASNSESLGVATVNRDAYYLQSESFREDELIYPTEDVFNKLLPFDALSDVNIRLRTRMIEAVKVIHESK